MPPIRPTWPSLLGASWIVNNPHWFSRGLPILLGANQGFIPVKPPWSERGSRNVHLPLSTVVRNR